MININRDMIAAAECATILAIADRDFLDTLAAHDNPSHLADLCCIELRDDLDNAIAIFCPSDATDAAIDDFCTRHAAAIDADDDFIFDRILDTILTRIALIFNAAPRP